MKQTRRILLIVLASLFAILLTLSLLGKFVFGWFDQKEESPMLPDLEAGESYYYLGGTPVSNVVLLFPQLSRQDLCEIKVHNTKGENYFFFQTQSASGSYFALGQCKGSDWEWEESDLYYPPILDSITGAFDYTSLYDNTSTIPGMLAAVGAVNISERIKPEGGVATDEWLSNFGMGKQDDPAYFELVTYYRDSAGNYIYTVSGEENVYVGLSTHDGKYYYIDTEKEDALGEEYTGPRSQLTPAANTDEVIRVYVGNPTIDDKGYYIYLEGRDVVYTTRNTYLPDVVERNMGYYIYPRLVSQPESGYASQLTPNLTYWKGNYFGIDSKVAISQSMTVTLDAPIIREVDSDSGEDVKKENHSFRFDMSALNPNPTWYSTLLGKQVGSAAFDLIVPSDNLYDGKAGESVTYTLLGLEGILRDGTYHTEGDITPRVGDHVLVTYTDGLTDGKGNPIVNTGFVNLGDPEGPPQLAALIYEMQLGKTYPETGEGSKSYTTVYGEDAPASTLKMSFDSILAIVDEQGKEAPKVAYGTTVKLSYNVTETTARGEEVKLGNITRILTIPKEEHYKDPAAWESIYFYQNAERQMHIMQAIFDAIMGKAAGSLLNSSGNSTVELSFSYPVECIRDFTLYRGVTVQNAVSYDMELSFGYTNNNDVYYGSSIYEILGPEEKTLYGLDVDSTTEVIRLFDDLKGEETVAVGLDRGTMEKYGLYAYRLYYELPFNLYTISSGDTTYYYHKNKVGYNLYISEKNKDGSRYIASEQYDIVVKVTDGSQYDFLTWQFEKIWVQRSMVMVGYEDLRQFVFDINYEDYQHIWGFDICVDRDYYYDGEDNVARLYASLVDGGVSLEGNSYQDLVGIFQYEETTDRESYEGFGPTDARWQHTVAGKFIREVHESLRYITTLKNGTDLDQIYKDQGFGDLIAGKDFAGAYYTKTLLTVLNSFCYWGTVEDDIRKTLPSGLTPEEQDAAIQQEIAAIMSETNRVLTMAMTLDDGEKSYGYVYRFYNYSYHSLVSVSKVDEAGNELTSNIFYVQSREVKKIAEMVIAISAGQVPKSDEY